MPLIEAIEAAAVALEPVLEPILVDGAKKLLTLILTSDDPKDALDRATRVLITEAANAAADEALSKLLPSAPKP